ncbi:MAG: BNR repeat-containing protein, partial [Candidatus Methylomirabilis sp.]|nr:BNR repeat-containing protein [Deltaproteobacteria bacterium]
SYPSVPAEKTLCPASLSSWSPDAAPVSANGSFLWATASERVGPQIAFVGEPPVLYAVYQNQNFDPEVVRRLPGEDLWSLPGVAGQGLSSVDAHGHPALASDALGRVHVFYGSHVSAIRHARNRGPAAPHRWDALPDIAEFATYPTTLSYPEGELLLFFRADRHYALLRSPDGETWSAPEPIVDWGDGYRIYPDAGVFQRAPDAPIHLSWSYYDYADGSHRGIYYARSADRGLTWSDSTGGTLASPISQEDSETVYFAADETTYGEDIVSDPWERPIILFSSRTDGIATYRLALRSDSGWTFRDLRATPEGDYGPMGGVLDVDPDGGAISAWLVVATEDASGTLLEEWRAIEDGAVERGRTLRGALSEPSRIFNPKLVRPEEGGGAHIFFQSAEDGARSFLFSAWAPDP